MSDPFKDALRQKLNCCCGAGLVCPTHGVRSDTPETDAAAFALANHEHSAILVRVTPANFARNLERERDEASEQAEKMREAIREAHRLLVAVDAGAQPDVEGLNWYEHRSQTLPKLQPFLT
jgi:hypothetical protein